MHAHGSNRDGDREALWRQFDIHRNSLASAGKSQARFASGIEQSACFFWCEGSRQRCNHNYERKGFYLSVVRHHSEHERIEKRDSECCVAMRRTVYHSLLDEPGTSRRDRLHFHA